MSNLSHTAKLSNFRNVVPVDIYNSIRFHETCIVISATKPEYLVLLLGEERLVFTPLKHKNLTNVTFPPIDYKHILDITGTLF